MENREIAATFREIGSCLGKTGEDNKFRIGAYFRAAQQIDQLDKELMVMWKAGAAYFTTYLNQFRSIGDKSRAKIVQLLEKGTCTDLEEVRAAMIANGLTYERQDKAPAPEKKTTRKASKNIREEVNAIRRPWAQADAVVQLVMPIAKQFFGIVTVCGSYRRHKDTVKDVDFIVSQPLVDGKMEELFTTLRNALGIDPNNVVKQGEAQMSVYYPGPDGKDWQVDFWFVDEQSHGSAILFATGSAEFNVQMRGWLKGRGYKLNRYGLYKAGATPEQDVLVASKTEEDIFKAIGMEWVPPPDRLVFNPPRVTNLS